MKNETLIKKNGARIKMRAQNRTKVMAAIVATGDNRFSFASHVHAARECADGGGGAAHRSAHRGGPLSRDRPRPGEPLCGTYQNFVSAGARPQPLELLAKSEAAERASRR